MGSGNAKAPAPAAEATHDKRRGRRKKRGKRDGELNGAPRPSPPGRRKDAAAQPLEEFTAISPRDAALGPRAATLRLRPLLHRMALLLRQGGSVAGAESSVAALVSSMGMEWLMGQVKQLLDPKNPAHRKAVYDAAARCKEQEQALSLAALSGAVAAERMPSLQVPSPSASPSSQRRSFGSKSPRGKKASAQPATNVAEAYAELKISPAFAEQIPMSDDEGSVPSTPTVQRFRGGLQSGAPSPVVLTPTALRRDVQRSSWQLLKDTCRAPLLAREIQKRSFALNCALRMLNRLGTATVDVSGALDIIVGEAKDTWGAGGCLVHVREGKQMIRLANEPLCALKTVPVTKGITGQALTAARTTYVSEPRTNPKFDPAVDSPKKPTPNNLVVAVATRKDESVADGVMTVAVTLVDVYEYLFNSEDTSVCGAFMSFTAALVAQALSTERIRAESKMFERIIRVAPRTVELMEEKQLVLNVMREAQELLHADRCSLFVVDAESGELDAYFGVDNLSPHRLPKQGIVGEVINTGKVLNIPDAYRDPRFNHEVDKKTSYRTRSILCGPLVFEGRILAAVQLLNKKSAPGHFTDHDEMAFGLFASFAGIALRNVRSAGQLARAEAEWRRLLTAFQNISEIDITQSGSILRSVVENARQITNADRCASFHVDFEHRCLVARTDRGDPIRIPMGAGIAGQCYQLSAPIIVSDAYQDARFNKEVDLKTGYKTKSILAIPISCDSTTLAVAQLINKKDSQGNVIEFDSSDVEILELFASFAGQMMRNADIHAHARESGDAVARLQETVRLRALDLPDIPRSPATPVVEGSPISRTFSKLNGLKQGGWEPSKRHQQALLSVDFPILEYLGDDDQSKLVRLVVECFKALGWLGGGAVTVSASRLVQCVQQLSTTHRTNLYHNFVHAFDTFQAMVFILNRLKRGAYLAPAHSFALAMASLFLDAGHLGLNRYNSMHYRCEGLFQPLIPKARGAAGSLAVAQGNVAAEILRCTENDVFSGLSPSDRQSAFHLMFDAILATDPQRREEQSVQFQRELIGAGDVHYDPAKPSHQQVLSVALINCARMSNAFRPFAVAKEWGIRWASEYYSFPGDEGSPQPSPTREQPPQHLGIPEPAPHRSPGGLSLSGQCPEGAEEWNALPEVKRAEWIAPSMVYYLETAVRPHFALVQKVVPELDFALRNIDVSLMQWKGLSADSPGPMSPAHRLPT
eukprot:TRINITY_DN60677_c0_g1_i1.p1 TRINITY_DN60677_c0_g1~~TRINITY_DN60677_c0_g1_i1.p1  ORF type:complete len:1211 (+),score=285.96 TRINITY_DN60677_c0_g1_i1:86-3718(+)